MAPDSLAERSGQLFIGDHLLAVNNQDVSNLERGNIVSLIKRSGLSIRLLVQQPQSMWPYCVLLQYKMLYYACYATGVKPCEDFEKNLFIRKFLHKASHQCQ